MLVQKIERPLSNLISEIAIPPPLAETILDTEVGEPWLVAVPELEQRLDSLHARPRVKAVRALSEVAEGLRIVVCAVSVSCPPPSFLYQVATKVRAFFLALFQPIRNSMSTNMQVIQTSILLKYRPLFCFLQRYAPPVASEIQRAYVCAARVY